MLLPSFRGRVGERGSFLTSHTFMDLSISYIFGEAWAFAKKNIVPFLVYSLITAAIGFVVVAVSMPSGFWSAWLETVQGNTHAAARLNQMQNGLNPLQLLQYVVSAILAVPAYNAIIGVCRGTRKFDFDCVKLPVAVYGKYVLWYLVYFIIIILGTLFFIVPGVYLGVRLWQGGFYLVEHHDANLSEAMKWSWDATRGRVLELLGLLLVGIVGIIALMIPCFILVVCLSMLHPVAAIAGAVVLVAVAFMCELVFYFANGMIYTTLCKDSAAI